MLALKAILEIVCFDLLIFQKEKLRPRKKKKGVIFQRPPSRRDQKPMFCSTQNDRVSIKSLKPQTTNVCISHVTKIPSPQMHKILPELTPLF